MLKVYRLDLHVHSCLSPCAELDMHPQRLVEGAVAAGLDAVAVCDHNSTENLPACMNAGSRVALHVIPGIEITSEEEVHILGLLPDLKAAERLQAEVYRALPGITSGPPENDRDRRNSSRAASGALLAERAGCEPVDTTQADDLGHASDVLRGKRSVCGSVKDQSGVYPETVPQMPFGLQVIANDCGEVLGFNRHFLSGATQLSVDEVVDRVHEAGGLAIASHADRESFGIIGQLGFIPPELLLDAVEISPNLGLGEGRNRFGGPRQLPVLCSSDAHRPEDIGRSITYMLLKQPSLLEIRRALGRVDGRAVLGGGKPMEDLALHILDIAQNALEAGANRIEIEITEDPVANQLTIQVVDNGKGMDEAEVQAVLDPFFTTRTTRKVGLGLPLLAQAARNADGDLKVCSRPGAGTTVHAHFRLDHIDRAPLGDLRTTLLVLFAGSPEADVVFRHVRGTRDFSFSSRDLAAVLNSTPISSPEGLALFREVFERGEADLKPSEPQAGPSLRSASDRSHGESV